jgi:hypothetical protein
LQKKRFGVELIAKPLTVDHLAATLRAIVDSAG